MSKVRVLAIVVLLGLALVLYEFSVVWQYPTSVIRIQQLYSINHYHTGASFKSPSLLKSNPNVRISHHNSSQSVFIVRQNASDAPPAINCHNATRISRNLKEFYRNYEYTFSDPSNPSRGSPATAHGTMNPKLEEETGFLCINESELWAHIVKKGSVSNLTSIQQRSALARAIVEYLQDDNKDSDEVEEWAKDVESRHDHQPHLSSLQTLATPGMNEQWPIKGTLGINVPLSETTGNAHENLESLATQRTAKFEPNLGEKEEIDSKDYGVNYLHELRQNSDKIYDQLLQALSRFLPDGEDQRENDEQLAGVEMQGKTDRGGEGIELVKLLKDVPQDKLRNSPLGQQSPWNLPRENLPQHTLRQDEQYNLPSDPHKNWPHNAPENFLRSIHTGNHQSLGTAKAVPDYYHVEQIDAADMQRRQYAQDKFKYGDHINTAQDRRVTQGPTDVAGHQVRYPIRASIQSDGGRMQPSKQAIQVVPWKQRPRLKKLPIARRNSTGLSREKVSMAYTRLSEQLLQLRGFSVAANKDLVTGRHFSPWKNSSEVASHLEALHQVVNGTELSRRIWTQYSLNEDIGARSKFQQAQLHQFCNMYHISNRLPSTPNDLDALFQHLLYDDAKRLIYCYVPKVGCSNMKRMMMILNGILPPESIENRPPEAQLKRVHSFRNLSTSDALHKLNNYYKFAIVRNPMERMLSAYRNKVETPYNHSNHHFPDKLKGYILRRFRKVEFWKWVEEGNQSVDIHPTFAEFLQFMLLYPLSYYNEHFKPVLNLCFPCAIHYDFYANFKSQDYDVYALMDYLGIPSAYYPHNASLKDKPTRSYLQEYYQALPADLKEEIFQTFRTELEFYYTLYPEERNMHVLL